jgi:hypothetical protein
VLGRTTTFHIDYIRVILLGQETCNDGEDNDGDGLVDNDDPDCIGACGTSEHEEVDSAGRSLEQFCTTGSVTIRSLPDVQ